MSMSIVEFEDCDFQNQTTTATNRKKKQVNGFLISIFEYLKWESKTKTKKQECKNSIHTWPKCVWFASIRFENSLVCLNRIVVYINQSP